MIDSAPFLHNYDGFLFLGTQESRQGFIHWYTMLGHREVSQMAPESDGFGPFTKSLGLWEARRAELFRLFSPN